MSHQIIRNHAIVIGIEIHVQLSNQSKIFSWSSAKFGQKANTCANMIDCALPGVLPQPNKDAFHKAIQFGLMVNAEINKKTSFARKNYFYPDLPKGYQITQDREPIVIGGHITLHDHKDKVVRLHHAHLEEDAGKTLHGQHTAGIDLNRAGSTLLEIVSEPDMFSISEAISYLKTMHSLVKYLDISDANMQEGSFRADINVSVRSNPDAPLGTRAEIKNLNSFRFIEKALVYEINRQIDTLERGEEVIQETRLFHESSQTTRSMRSKEDAADYRYFPEPDLCPLIIGDKFIEDIQKQMPTPPQEKIKDLIDAYGFQQEDARMLVFDKVLSQWFHEALECKIDPKMVANWLTVNLQSLLNKHQIQSGQIPIQSTQFIQLLKAVHNQTLSGSKAKEVMEVMWQSGDDPNTIIEKLGIKQITSTEELSKVVSTIIKSFPTQVSEYKSGKDKLLGFFVGQAMKATKGQAKPDLLKEIVIKSLRDD